MKAIYFNKFGGANELEIGELPAPVAGENEILIKINHTSVNPVDWKIREGYLKDMFPHDFPIIPGWDVSGVVTALGSKTSKFAIGDKVYAYARKPTVSQGTYAEFIALEESAVANIPAKLSSAEAASVPLVGLTAYQSIRDVLDLRADEVIYITSGSGGVGSLAIQIAKSLGATVITAASAGKQDFLRELGADVTFDYKVADIPKEIKSLYPSGVDAIFDTVGGESLENSYRTLKKNGKLVSITDTPSEEVAKSIGAQFSFHFVEPNGEQLKKLADGFNYGTFRIPHVEIRNIKEAADAHIVSEKGRTLGKVVLETSF